MMWRDRVAVHLSPLPLRAALAATFIWAGLGKILVDEPVDGVDAADLATMGLLPGTAAPPVETTPTVPAPKVEPPQPESPATPAPQSPSPSPSSESPSGPPAPLPAPSTPPAPKGGAWLGPSSTPQGPAMVLVAQDVATATKAPVVRRMYSGIALTVYRAAGNGLEHAANGKPASAIWPGALGSGDWPKYQAWAVSLTELVGGGFLLVGLATRLSAFMLVGVMLGAMWLTQIGPAVSSGQTVIGFLPNHGAFDVKAWTPFFWQLALLGGAATLVLSGPGSLSLDRWLGSSSRDDDGDDGIDE